jgi:hypothetical protein
MKLPNGMEITEHEPHIFGCEVEINGRPMKFRIDGREGPYRVDMAGFGWEAIDGGVGFDHIEDAGAYLATYTDAMVDQGTMWPDVRRT